MSIPEPKPELHLVEYGIHTEESDYRAHVCVVVHRLYWFRTVNGKTTVEDGNFPEVSVTVNGQVTAYGCLVPPGAIPFCQEYDIPSSVMGKAAFDAKDSASAKGDKAARVVRYMLAKKLIPHPTITFELIPEGHPLQMQGCDIRILLDAKVEVKCDWNGGPKEAGGTGNLFLQTHERNPGHQY